MEPRSTTQVGWPRRCGLGQHAAEEHDAGGLAAQVWSRGDDAEEHDAGGLTTQVCLEEHNAGG